MYGNYFTKRGDLPVQNSVQKRDVDICPRVQSWDDLILRLTNDDELIQVVQFDNDNRQWILEESCSQSTCSFVPQCACGTWTRLVRALVVNFDETIIEEKYIKVYCCIAKKISV
ncbi:uncharacterized protein LOC119737256 [Patiria miniata]|uniref:Uncharacterized protein n=1 Tax=Patiria miniata TaxID=46514 RepID=A0A914AUN8_PATMI|nr:uncharacterized protein LOC119737256 [Patiria miniata]